MSVVEWLLFRPELLVVNHRVSEGLSTDQAHKFLSGEFKGLAHETNGKAGIYDIGGRKVLRFTNFSTSNGPDVHVYLVASPNASDDNAARQPASSILAA